MKTSTLIGGALVLLTANWLQKQRVYARSAFGFPQSTSADQPLLTEPYINVDFKKGEYIGQVIGHRELNQAGLFQKFVIVQNPRTKKVFAFTTATSSGKKEDTDLPLIKFGII